MTKIPPANSADQARRGGGGFADRSIGTPTRACAASPAAQGSSGRRRDKGESDNVRKYATAAPSALSPPPLSPLVQAQGSCGVRAVERPRKLMRTIFCHSPLGRWDGLPGGPVDWITTVGINYATRHAEPIVAPLERMESSCAAPASLTAWSPSTAAGRRSRITCARRPGSYLQWWRHGLWLRKQQGGLWPAAGKNRLSNDI